MNAFQLRMAAAGRKMTQTLQQRGCLHNTGSITAWSKGWDKGWGKFGK